MKYVETHGYLIDLVFSAYRPYAPPTAASLDQMPAILTHYAWMGYLWLHMGVLKGFVFFAVAQMGCGLFLALVFGLGHNGMALYDADARPDFWKLQVRRDAARDEGGNGYVLGVSR